MSKVQCVLCSENRTTEGRGGEKGGSAIFKIKLTEPLTSELISLPYCHGNRLSLNISSGFIYHVMCMRHEGTVIRRTPCEGLQQSWSFFKVAGPRGGRPGPFQHDDLCPDTTTFDPAALDTYQWAASFAAMVAREAVLVAKHSCGFALWPSNATEPDGSRYNYR